MSQPTFEHCYIGDEILCAKLTHFRDGLLYHSCFEWVMDLSMEYAPSKEPVPFEEISSLQFQPIQVGEVWARENFACAWVHVTGKLPEGTDRTSLYLDFGCDGEALLVDANGHSLKGFTAGSPVFGIVDTSVEKRYYPLDELLDEEGKLDFYIDAASNSLQGELHEVAKIYASAVMRIHERRLQVYYDFCVLFDYARHIPYSNPHRRAFCAELRKVMNLIVYGDPDCWTKSKAILEGLMAVEGKNETQVTAIGHAHLDLAWLWPVRESKRKAKRTFANAVYLMKRYPEYHFAVPQPQQLEWMKQLDPVLYEEIKGFVAEGRMEPVGGGWVENDTNLPCEESLVRQELYGQKFWLEEFGRYVHLRWLPDTFGYSASLPQILRLSQQDSFMTIKLSWSTSTLFPYHTFYWEGIDGSQITVHMPPEGTYNSLGGARALMHAQNCLRPEDEKDTFLQVFGVGDGGGGPSRMMVESVLRTKEIGYLPKTKMGTAQSFFDGLKGRNLPVYQGEMYLEKHRGTYTSQSNNKNFNREFEEKMLTLEALLSALGRQGDKAAIDTLWKEALLYQFHDVIPGSSIKRVYDETDEAYKAMFAKLESLAEELGVSFKANANRALVNLTGRAVSTIEQTDNGYLYYQGTGASIAPVVYKNGAPMSALNKVETNFYTVEFDANGWMKEIKLKDGRLAVKDANQLRVFIDTGDAWDFEDDYRDQPAKWMTMTACAARDFGDLVEVKQTYSYQNSTLQQTILIHKTEPIIRILHDVDWKDNGYMLRAEFSPSAWSDTAYSDIQFGYLGRPTADDTEHNAAQFETCCQKWFDVSNETQGFAVLNNAKCGFMAKEQTFSIDLLRATNYPCVTAEQKPIHYSYALYPHAGGFDPVKIDMLAGQFNARPVYGNVAVCVPTVDNEAVQITAFKPAYQGDGFILRMFERSGKGAETTLALPKGYQMAYETDLLEDKLGEATEGKLVFKPFQIRTFKIVK